jgi:hypothetical protein
MPELWAVHQVHPNRAAPKILEGQQSRLPTYTRWPQVLECLLTTGGAGGGTRHTDTRQGNIGRGDACSASASHLEVGIGFGARRWPIVLEKGADLNNGSPATLCGLLAHSHYYFSRLHASFRIVTDLTGAT